MGGSTSADSFHVHRSATTMPRNSQGNHYSTPGGTNSSSGTSYHYSNTNGSYCAPLLSEPLFILSFAGPVSRPPPPRLSLGQSLNCSAATHY